MLTKLEEFFSQQLHSSVRAISSWTHGQTRQLSPKHPRQKDISGQEEKEPGL